MARPRDWPAELRKPIVAQELTRGIYGLLGEAELTGRSAQKCLQERYARECLRRLEIMRSFFGLAERDFSDAYLIIRLCDHWNIPAFHISNASKKGRGRSKIWTDIKHCELFADVKSLVENGLSEHGACRILATQRKY